MERNLLIQTVVQILLAKGKNTDGGISNADIINAYRLVGRIEETVDTLNK